MTNLAFAQLPSPHLRSIHPCGAKVGTSIDVTIAGSELDDINGLLFSHPGIKAERIIVPASEFYPEHPEPFRFRINIAKDVPPGKYDAHAQSRLGLSSARPFVVGILDELSEPGTNKEAVNAFELPIGVVLNGRADGNSIDYFRFKAKKGERLLIQCHAERIGSRMDATLAIDDSTGREILSNRDTLGRDPLLDFIAPADGDYLLRIYDFTYGGGDEFYYRLLINNAPHIDFIVPPAAIPGTTSKFKLYGRNLPGGSTGEGVRLGSQELESREVEITLPAESQAADSSSLVREALLPGFDYRFETNGSSSNPIRIGFAEAPIITEIESPEDQALSLPTEIHGKFDHSNDLDRFRFEAKKGTPLWIDCLAERLGNASDPLLIIESLKVDDKGSGKFSEVHSNDDGADPGGRHFPLPSRDPSWLFSPPEDGTYRVTVMNQTGQGGPASLYRLVIREHQPDFDLVATSWKPHRESKLVQPVPSLLRQGGTAAFQVFAMRRDGFQGEITVSADKLPAGVTCPPVQIPEGQDLATLILRSAEDAPDWNGFITLRGQAGDTIREARAGTISWAVSNYESERVRTQLSTRLPLSVSSAEKAPVTVQRPEKVDWEVTLGGKVELPIKLLKRNGVKGDFVIQPEGALFKKNPPQLKINEKDTEGTLAITFNKTNDFPVEPGVWQFVLRGDGIVNYRNNPAAAERAEIDRKRLTDLKAQLEKQAKDARAAVEPARQVLKKAEQTFQSASAEAKPELQAAVDNSRSALQTIEQAAKEAEERSKRAENERRAAEERLKTANERAKERDVKISTYSLPITVRVTAPTPKAEAK
ncbi:hypothetical protein N9A94_03195 [Akkermansiaceae bacterium]|nr:hypothetical protein [Akkermansiaceae bacterium]MDA7888173.1 hypothetical protein [Akkermansiaceae bacterium]MDB4537695.1 hypothetical protein [Akkermansiaceae bacterium]